ncbi:DeoR/GlpR family DNA-binding transcription regulator [Anaerococcus porci]|nr:DeoR/GlpR family DNA-binding transcription regulator [Anaerococcus porci]
MLKYIQMIFEKRLEIILDTLKEFRQVSNKILIDKLDISESTLRRDLDFLEQRGEIKRVHGGAILTNVEFEEKSYDKNIILNIDKKCNIAKKASNLIGNSKYIFLDAGTTTNLLIDYLDKDINVVTNGIMHIDKLNKKKIKTILLGGLVKSKTNVTIGEKTILELSSFNFDIAFIGANGYANGEFTTHDPSEAKIKRLAIERSRKAYILADSSKKNRIYFSKICSINEVDLIREDL